MTKGFLSFVIAFFSFFSLLSQNEDWIHYTVEDGLPTNYVYGAVQDERGILWFHTEQGLSRFDGYDFINYTTDDGLADNDIPEAFIGPGNRIYLSTFSNNLAYVETDSIGIVKSNSL